MIARYDFEGDSNVGAFGIATDRYVFVSPNMSERSIETMERVFNLPLVQSTIATLDVIGLVCVANSNGILLPYTTNDDELAALKEYQDIRVDWIDNKMTALGNIILANDNGAICHPDFDKNARAKIADALDVEVIPSTVANLPTVGSNSATTNQGAVVHPMATTGEIEMPPDVYNVFKELYDNAVERMESFRTRKSKSTRVDPKKPAQIFPSVGSTQVNRFLSSFDKDLTAKVFRTFHATLTMKEELRRSKAKRTDPEFIKKEAVKRANLEVARVMNHTKQAPKGWSKSSDRYRERISKASERIKKAEKQLADKRKKLRAVKKKEKDNLAKRQATVTKQKEIVEKNKKSVALWREKRNSAKITWDNARDRKRRTRGSKRKGKTTKKHRLEDAQASIDRTRDRLERAEESLARARERYNKSKESLEKKQQVLASFREKSTVRISRSEKTVRSAKERVDKTKLGKRKIETDFALARDCRTWNLGTALKSYIHPKTVYKWCQKVEYPWRKVYPATLQRKFAWVETRS